MSEQLLKAQLDTTLLPKRWAKAVVFASPMSARTPEMLDVYRKANNAATARTLLAEQLAKSQKIGCR